MQASDSNLPAAANIVIYSPYVRLDIPCRADIRYRVVAVQEISIQETRSTSLGGSVSSLWNYRKSYPRVLLRLLIAHPLVLCVFAAVRYLVLVNRYLACVHVAQTPY